MKHGSDAPLIDASSRDLAALQGAWEQVRLEVDGMIDPPDGFTVPGALTVIAGHHFCVRLPTGEVLLEGSFELDADTLPASITWIDAIGEDAGKRLPASYRLDGDSFVFIAADEGMPRPRDFRTTPGLTLRGFVRHPRTAEPPATSAA